MNMIIHNLMEPSVFTFLRNSVIFGEHIMDEIGTLYNVILSQGIPKKDVWCAKDCIIYSGHPAHTYEYEKLIRKETDINRRRRTRYIVEYIFTQRNLLWDILSISLERKFYFRWKKIDLSNDFNFTFSCLRCGLFKTIRYLSDYSKLNIDENLNKAIADIEQESIFFHNCDHICDFKYDKNLIYLTLQHTKIDHRLSYLCMKSSSHYSRYGE